VKTVVGPASQLPELITRAIVGTSPLQEHLYTKQSLHQLIDQLQQQVHIIQNNPSLKPQDSDGDGDGQQGLVNQAAFKELQDEQMNLTQSLLQLQQLTSQNSLQVRDQINKNYSEIMKRITAVSQLTNKQSPETNQKIEKLSQELDEVRERLSGQGREDLEGVVENFLKEIQMLKRSLSENESHLLERLKKKADLQEIEKYACPLLHLRTATPSSPVPHLPSGYILICLAWQR
jgi:hypothetical protein